MSRAGFQAFQAPRLAQALAARGLTQAQLAALVGVSPATVSKWRAGSQAPEAPTFERLASVLNVAPEWFTRAPLPPTTTPLFRSNASALAAARAKLSARLQWGEELALRLGEFVDYPALNLPERRFTDPEQISDADIEEAADECRALWRLGRAPIADLMLAVEGAGVLVVREATDVAKIEGLSAWSAALGRPVVLLSSDKANGYRSRFDLAHEVGHLAMHRHIERTHERDRHRLLEQQAHRFAGALLLPAESFAQDVHPRPTLDDLRQVKRRWGASVAAIIMRLRALDIIDDDEYLSLQKRLSARWGRKAEQGDDERAPELPRVLRRTIDLLHTERVMPLEAIPGHIGLAAGDVASLAGLPERYFNGCAEVVSLARLRSAPGNSSPNVARADAASAVVPFRPPPAKP